MQLTPDKEIDKLFQDGFKEFEIRPSRSLWHSIEKQIDAPERKQGFSVFWMAAASVVIVFVAGLYFFRPQHALRLQVESKEQMPVESEHEGLSKEVLQALIPKKENHRLGQTVLPEPKQPNPADRELKETKTHDLERLPEEVTAISKMEAKTEAHEILHVNEIEMVTIPDQKNEERSVIAVNTSDPDVSEPLLQHKPRIRSIGDLVNFVVAKVDQREDKIIEMSDDDEGASISGINLGVLKIKSVKNKHRP